MTHRTRVAALAAFVVLAMAAAGGYVWYARAQQQQAAANAPAVATRDDLAAVTAKPHVVFRSTALGQGYGQVAITPLTEPGSARAFTPASCERVYAVPTGAICLSADRGIVTTYHSQILGRDWQPAVTLPLTGLPSRARLSGDGSLAATTTFVFGDSYAQPGQFSTRTLVSRTDGSSTEDLEPFQLIVGGKPNTASDRNLWGVTFASDDIFYATAASGGRTWLVKGSLSSRTLTSLRDDVECPSVSPDGTRIAFKKHGNLSAGQWRLAVFNLATGRETVLAETRSVDDQVVWLDNKTIIYGLPRQQQGTASSDVWSVPADGSGSARVLIADAWSPSIVR